jgi:hypothetical protein
MKPSARISKRLASLLLLLSILCDLRAKVTIWDTTKPAQGPVAITDRAQWKAIPSNLMMLEKDPIKASSDPGYYGREYQFTGDAVFENDNLLAAFSTISGRITLFSKAGAPVAKLSFHDTPAASQFELIRNAADEVVLDVLYSGEAAARFTFDKTEIIEISQPRKLPKLKIASPLDYAIVPGFVADDLIFGPQEDASTEALSIPAENILLGLIKAEEHALVMTWPSGKQRVRLNLAPEQEKKRPIESIDFETAEQSVYLAILSAPGIWHREELTASFLEKEAPIQWKRPFPAKWQTQLIEGSVKTTYVFHEHKGTVWRGVPGSYEYPVRFDGDQAIYHLSKKVPPKGESIIYFLEGDNTPGDVLTPVDILKATLGRPAAESILDVAGRKLRTHHGASGSDVHRACTCGYTEAIQAVFEKGNEVDQKPYIDQSINDMIYFVQRHLERIDEYREFSKQLTSFVQARAKENPAIKPYLEEIEQAAQQIPQEYENQKENMKSLDYAGELSKKTLALTERKDPKNLQAYMDLLKAWRAMGGAQDYLVAQYHTLTRKLFQDAAYLAANDPKAIEAAQEIRARCKQILRNPDGYEIWPNF